MTRTVRKSRKTTARPRRLLIVPVDLDIETAIGSLWQHALDDTQTAKFRLPDGEVDFYSQFGQIKEFLRIGLNAGIQIDYVVLMYQDLALANAVGQIGLDIQSDPKLVDVKIITLPAYYWRQTVGISPQTGGKHPQQVQADFIRRRLGPIKGYD